MLSQGCFPCWYLEVNFSSRCCYNKSLRRRWRGWFLQPSSPLAISFTEACVQVIIHPLLRFCWSVLALGDLCYRKISFCSRLGSFLFGKAQHECFRAWLALIQSSECLWHTILKDTMLFLCKTDIGENGPTRTEGRVPLLKNLQSGYGNNPDTH